MTTQPAGAHHTSPITHDMVEQAAKAACEHVYPPKTHEPWDGVDDYERDSWRSTARVLLEAAYPAIRQHVAEQIAAAFEPMLHNSPDGDAFEHTHPKWEGEPECPACWVDGIRQTLAREIGGGQ